MSNYRLSKKIEALCPRRGVAAILVTAESRYLMQLRDNLAHVTMRNHWCLFGGWANPGENPKSALLRELDEELSFSPNNISWFTEITYQIPGVNSPPLHKTFFEVPISNEQYKGMNQHEGADMELFSQTEINNLSKLVPWDGLAIRCHSMRNDFGHLHHNALF